MFTSNFMGDSAIITGASSMSRSNVVFCRGLSFKATEADIRVLLADCGDILSVIMPLDARARPSGTAYVEFDSFDACTRAVAKAASGISHLGRYIEIMPRTQRSYSQSVLPHPIQNTFTYNPDVGPVSSGLARILAAQPKKKPLSHDQSRLPDDSGSGPVNTDPNCSQGPSADRQRAVTPRKAQSDGLAMRIQPCRDPKNAGTPSTLRMPIDVACRICIGAEVSGKLSPLEDYDREITWIEHDLAGATEKLERYRRELFSLTQDKVLLEEQVTEEMKSRHQRVEERKGQIEVLKAAKFNCRRLMSDILRNMPAAALQGETHRYCTQSDLKAQIKRLQEVSEQDPESIVDKPDVHAKPDISINGIRKVWGQSRLILETEKRVSDYISRLSAASRTLAEAESALSFDIKGQRSVTPGRAQLSEDIRDCISKRNAARNEVEVLLQMLAIVKKERVRSVKRHDFVVQQQDVALNFGDLCRSMASCGWHFCTLPAGHQGRCQVCPLETVIYCNCKENTLTVQCGREKEHVPCPNCDKYGGVPMQPISALGAFDSAQPSTSDWILPGTEWGIQDSALNCGISCEKSVIVKDSPCSKHVDTGISPESAPDRSELLTISPNLDESVDAVRAFQKRQLSDSKISSVKKSSGQAVKAAHATASGYDGPIYKPKILSHEAMMARVHDLLKAEELSSTCKGQEQSGKVPSKLKEVPPQSVTPPTKSESVKTGRLTPSARSRSSTPSADHRGKHEVSSNVQHQQQQQQHDIHQKASKRNQQSLVSSSSSSDLPDTIHLCEDDIRRRILEVKKQKKGTTAWSFASTPYIFAALFAVIVGVIIFLSLVPEDSRFFNHNTRREQLSERHVSSSYDDDDYEQGQHQMYETHQQQQHWQREKPTQRSNAEAGDGSTWKTGQDDDDFYENAVSDSIPTDDGDDDYAPWNKNTARHTEPALSRTHRVVQQRMVPPDPGE